MKKNLIYLHQHLSNLNKENLVYFNHILYFCILFFKLFCTCKHKANCENLGNTHGHHSL